MKCSLTSGCDRATSNCRGVLQRLVGSEGMGEYPKLLGSSSGPQGRPSRGCRGSSGSGGVMGDSGRDRCCMGSGTAAYLARRFLKGARSSVRGPELERSII